MKRRRSKRKKKREKNSLPEIEPGIFLEK